MDIFNSDLSIPINLIRQWHFCPRVVYYQELLNMKVNKPLWVSQGENWHDKIEKLEKRRSYHRYNLMTAKRQFKTSLKSTQYGLHGIVDWILETEDEIFVVEYKINPKPNSLGHKLQLCAYAMLAQEHYKKPCTKSFLVSEKTSYEIAITQKLIDKVIETTIGIRQMLVKAVKPDSAAAEYQCIQCEYLNFCNDR